jgi:iron complex transport system substrate-binding protein
VTVRNCGEDATFPHPAKRLFVNDGNLISMVLAIGAEGQVAAVSSLQRDADVLREHYGSVVDRLPVASATYPSRETVLASTPDVVVAGWSYGYDEAKGLTPANLRKQGIAPYILTESCRRAGGAARGVVDPWSALRTDLENLGRITGREAEAARAVADLNQRLDGLRAAPRSDTSPTVFVFDSGTRAIVSSGRFGAPQAIIDAAGARNALEDIEDSWVEVSWERMLTSKPDAFVFVDYPPQTFAEKVAILKARTGVRDLGAVKDGRFLNLPYAMWTSGPLNIDAAERLRAALERWELVPRSGAGAGSEGS